LTKPLDLLPGGLEIKTRSGNDVAFQISLPYDATAGTHQILVATSLGGDSVAEFLDGDGLTISGTNPTLIDVLIPVAFTSKYPGVILYFDYNLTLGGILKTKISGTIQSLRGIVKKN
jgi:hypothetical protein